jgi:hypothetical protein
MSRIRSSMSCGSQLARIVSRASGHARVDARRNSKRAAEMPVQLTLVAEPERARDAAHRCAAGEQSAGTGDASSQRVCIRRKPVLLAERTAEMEAIQIGCRRQSVEREDASQVLVDVLDRTTQPSLRDACARQSSSTLELSHECVECFGNDDLTGQHIWRLAEDAVEGEQRSTIGMALLEHRRAKRDASALGVITDELGIEVDDLKARSTLAPEVFVDALWLVENDRTWTARDDPAA